MRVQHAQETRDTMESQVSWMGRNESFFSSGHQLSVFAQSLHREPLAKRNLFNLKVKSKSSNQ